jgi:hypothetical protein
MIAELIALAKAADYLVAGHAGNGTSQHLAGECSRSWLVKIQQVPYGTTASFPTSWPRLNIFFGTTVNLAAGPRRQAARVRYHCARVTPPERPRWRSSDSADATAWSG